MTQPQEKINFIYKYCELNIIPYTYCIKYTYYVIYNYIIPDGVYYVNPVTPTSRKIGNWYKNGKTVIPEHECSTIGTYSFNKTKILKRWKFEKKNTGKE